MFRPSNMLQKYLMAQPRDMYDIQGALIGYINADPYFNTDDFDKAIEYVLSQGITEAELYQEFNTEIDFQEDEAAWDKDYYAHARVYLQDNFCKKRIQHVKNVANKLHPKEKALAMPDRNIRGGQQRIEKKTQNQQENSATTQKSVGTKSLIFCGVAIFLMVVIVFIIRKIL